MLLAHFARYPVPNHFEDQIYRLTIASNIPHQEIRGLDVLTHATAYYGDWLYSHGKHKEAEKYLLSWPIFATQTINDANDLPRLLSAAHFMQIQANAATMTYEHAREWKKADQTRAAFNSVFAEYKAFRADIRNTQRSPNYCGKNYAGIYLGMMLSTLDCGNGEVNKQTLAPSRIAEYSYAEGLILITLPQYIAAWFLLTLFRLYRWKRLVKGGTTAPCPYTRKYAIIGR